LFGKPSLVTRIAIGKGIGFLVGLIGFVFLPFFLPEAGWLIRWGILLWYTTLGAIIGVFGVFTWHPVLKLPMPWWIRAPVIGAWMNFVLTFFACDESDDDVAIRCRWHPDLSFLVRRRGRRDRVHYRLCRHPFRRRGQGDRRQMNSATHA
jgi:hypothetical protein